MNDLFKPQLLISNGGVAMTRLTVCVFLLSAVFGCRRTDGGTSASYERWPISPDPTITIKDDENPAVPLYLVTGAARIRSGYLVVNGSAGELRLYEDDGRLASKVGRLGEGPGEFRSPTVVNRLPNDTIVIYDSSNQRVSLVCDGIRICAEFRMRQIGRVLGATQEYWVIEYVSPTTAISEGITHTDNYYLAVNRLTQDVDTLMYLEGQPKQVVYVADSFVVMPIPFTGAPQVTVSADNVILASERDSLVHIANPKDGRRTSIGLPVRADQVSNEEFSSYINEKLRSMSPSGLSIMGPALKAMKPPAHRAPIKKMLVDRLGLIWVEVEAENPDTHKWLVSDRHGKVRAFVNIDFDMDLLEVGDNYIVGLREDSLDVEFVQVYGLQRR